MSHRGLVRIAAIAVFAALGAACIPVTAPPPQPKPKPKPPKTTTSTSTTTTTTTTPGTPVLSKTMVTSVAGGVIWDLAFAPDSSLFFTQRSGAIWVRRTGTNTNLGAVPGVRSTGGEGGLMGLALDPAWDQPSGANHNLYFCYSWKDPSSSATENRVARWEVKPTFDGFTTTDPTVIVAGLPHNDGASGRHSGCRPRFQPGTGLLFVGTGDAAQGANPQSVSSLGGKVLRVDKAGTAIPDNPFVGVAGDDRIYTLGHRNVQGIAFRPGTNAPFSAEHGPGVEDELNRLVSGANYGWDPVPNYNEGVPMTDTTKFPTAISATWNSGNLTVAPSGLVFLTGAQWKAWDGRAVLAALDFNNAIGQRLITLQLNAAGTAFEDRDDAFEDGVRKRSVVQGLDGFLYYSTDTGEIWRVVPQ